MIWISAALVFAMACLAGLGVQLSRKRRRERACRPREGESVVLAAESLPARVFVDKDLLGGPTSGAINRAQANLVLTAGRLLIGTHHGRLLELTPKSGGSVRNTGPNRLVIEGQQPGQGALVRVEILTDQAERWASLSEQTIQTSRTAA